jgi:hypothetical protein
VNPDDTDQMESCRRDTIPAPPPPFQAPDLEDFNGFASEALDDD